MKFKKIMNYDYVGKLNKINNYVSCSKVFFDNLDKYIEKCDTTKEQDLVDFYVNVRLELKKMKEVLKVD